MSEVSQVVIFSVHSAVEALSIFMVPQVLGTIPMPVDKWGLFIRARFGFRTKAIAHPTVDILYLSGIKDIVVHFGANYSVSNS